MTVTQLIAGLMLIHAVTAGAQAANQTRPIAGNWGVGDRVLLQLKAPDGKSVTGVAILGRPDNTAPISKGSFDARTGVLKLEGEGKDADTGAALHYAIEGKLEGDSLRVTATFGSRKSTKTLTRAVSPPG